MLFPASRLGAFRAGVDSELSRDRSRNIWILHHYADPPDGYWTGTFDLYKPLVDRGHRITVFSSSFSHYSRTDTRLRIGETYREQEFDGMQFVFVRTTPYQHNDWRRVMNMLTYALRTYRIARRRTDVPDIIIGSTPHPFCTAVAARLARETGARFFLELHDLWLEYMIDTGKLARHGPVALALRQLDAWCYRRADRIMTLWPLMDHYLEGFGIDRPERIVWVPMGVRLQPEPANGNGSGSAHEGRFTVVCTARFGPGSNVDEILKAARVLEDEGEDQIRFVLVGGGPEEHRLRGYARDHGLRNVEFTGMVPKADIPRHLFRADACIAGLPDVPTYRFGTIPSKVLDYLTMGRPVIFISAVDNNVVARSSGGIVVPPGQPAALAEAIQRLAGMPKSERDRLGANGRRYIREHHDLDMLATRIESLF